MLGSTACGAVSSGAAGTQGSRWARLQGGWLWGQKRGKLWVRSLQVSVVRVILSGGPWPVLRSADLHGASCLQALSQPVL